MAAMRRASVLWAVFVGASAAFGCAGGRSDLEKKVRALQDEVTLLHNSNDRLEDRLAAMELGLAEAAVGQRQAPPAERLARPPLKVVRLDPGAPDPVARSEPSPAPLPEAPSAGADAERPLIRGEGTEAQIVQGEATAEPRQTARKR